MKKRLLGIRKGFTLAEVLITLGIIGVVAAMTIPTLIQNTNSVKFATQFKKDISTLSQAALMAQAQYDIDYGMTTVKCGYADAKPAVGTEGSSGYEPAVEAHGTGGADRIVSGANASICGILNTTLAGKTYLGMGSAVKSAADSSESYTWAAGDGEMPTLKGGLALANMHVYTLADGSLVGIHKDAKNCTTELGETIGNLSSGDLKDCIGFVDVNGTALPNKEVKCATASDTVLNPSSTCTVTTKSSDMGDLFPIVFHDGTVEPASNAAKAVLTRGK